MRNGESSDDGYSEMNRDSVAVADRFTCFELVHRAAVRAARFAGLGHVQIHLGVGVPELHVCLGAGTEHAALGVQVFGQQFNSGVAHGVFLRLWSASGRTWDCGR